MALLLFILVQVLVNWIIFVYALMALFEMFWHLKKDIWLYLRSLSRNNDVTMRNLTTVTYSFIDLYPN